MNNSILFYTRPNSGITNGFMHYDCCEHLGSNLNDYKVKTAYIAIPTKELHPFFLNPDMIAAYTKLITEALDVSFELATPEEVATIEWSGSKVKASDCVVIKHTRKNSIANKMFNSPYNVLRYLWYRHYTNMALIATNLYLLNIFDPIDIIAIASSYQQQNSRALLPSKTHEIQGLLFFRPKAEIIKDLNSTSSFNGVFYKYPVYFNPIVEVSGSFFSEAKNTIAAKETIERLGDVEDISELPGFIRSNVRVIAEDYNQMKQAYLNFIKLATSMSMHMSFNDPLLLSKEMKYVPVRYGSSIGGSYTKYVSISSNNDVTIDDNPPKGEPKKRAKKEEVLVEDVLLPEDMDFEEDDE